jgi:adenine specific DNA methylase Mod
MFFCQPVAGGVVKVLDGLGNAAGCRMTNALYYGDNLPVLRESIADESIDLIYLDPPFNSNASYNVLFKAPSGKGSQAQIEAFEDTWHWNIHAEQAFDETIKSGNTDAASLDGNAFRARRKRSYGLSRHDGRAAD